MPLFLVTLGVGLAGLLLMAVPGVRRQGRAGRARSGHARSGHVRGGRVHAGHVRTGRAPAGRRSPARAGGPRAGRAALGPGGRRGSAHAARAVGRGGAGPKGGAVPGATPPVHAGEGIAYGLLHYAPEPRIVFTLIALFGAFGNVINRTIHAPLWISCTFAAAAAALTEWLVVGPVWRLALRFTGEPSSPLEALVLDRARALTSFRNGKGIVQVVRDGRALQMTAELIESDRDARVEVGDALTIEDVDATRERVFVSLHG